jgi:hypothetical protein
MSDSAEQITKDTEALARAEARMREGKAALMEIPAQDIRPIVRSAVYWRNLAMDLWEERAARQKDAMSVGEPD